MKWLTQKNGRRMAELSVGRGDGGRWWAMVAVLGKISGWRPQGRDELSSPIGISEACLKPDCSNFGSSSWG